MQEEKYQVKESKINPTKPALDNTMDSINKTDITIKILQVCIINNTITIYQNKFLYFQKFQ